MTQLSTGNEHSAETEPKDAKVETEFSRRAALLEALLDGKAQCKVEVMKQPSLLDRVARRQSNSVAWTAIIRKLPSGNGYSLEIVEASGQKTSVVVDEKCSMRSISSPIFTAKCDSRGIFWRPVGETQGVEISLDEIRNNSMPPFKRIIFKSLDSTLGAYFKSLHDHGRKVGQTSQN